MTLITFTHRLFVIPCLIIASFLFFNACTEEKPTEPEPTSAATEFYETVVKTQEQKAELFEELVSSIDTLAAMDSVLKIFLQDTLVDWGETSRQGIAIQYKNGIRGGIFIDPLDYPNSDDLLFDPNLNKTVTSFSFDNIQNIIPASKQTIFLNPSYWERKKYADQLIENYQTRLKNVGFSNPIVYKNEEVTVDKFDNLNNYGIIHVYSHGWAWPKMNNIKKVFLLLGEKYSHETANKYFAELLAGDLIAVYYKKINATVFLISPDFINNLNNDFTSTSPLFYGGFCFSNLGNWPNVIVNWLGAGGYFGFSWFVRTSANAKWNEKIIETLTDTSNGQANTVNDWMTNDFPKQYWCKKAERYVKIINNGKSDLALIEKEEQEPVIIDGYYLCRITSHALYDLLMEKSGSDGSVETETYSSIDIGFEAIIYGDVKNYSFIGNYEEGVISSSVDIRFDNNYENIESISLTHTIENNNEVGNFYYSINAANIPKADWSEGIDCSIIGSNYCNSLQMANYSKSVTYSDGGVTYTKTTTTQGFNCNDMSGINVIFYKQ